VVAVVVVVVAAAAATEATGELDPRADAAEAEAAAPTQYPNVNVTTKKLSLRVINPS